MDGNASQEDSGGAPKTDGKKDFAWGYATLKLKGLLCNFCGKKSSGGIYRIKHHLAKTKVGMAACITVTGDVSKKCKKALETLAQHKQKRNDLLIKIQQGAEFHQREGEKRSKENEPLERGPIDAFTNFTAREKTLNSKWKKDQRNVVCQKIGRFIFSAGLSFNVSNDPYYVPMCEAISEYGPGFKPPTMHEFSTWILKAEVEDIDKDMEEHKKIWKKYGCSIMSDGWIDGKSRSLINFLVNSSAGTWFLRSIDASDTIKSGDKISDYLGTVIKEIGAENVVHEISDNGPNYVNAGQRLMQKYKNLYWTPCAAHCIDLMLEDIGKMKIYQTAISKAKQTVKFIYGHTWVLELMRSFTKGRELLRPAVTRFATAYLTLQSIHKQKQALQNMFSSGKWSSSCWGKNGDGEKARHTMLFDKHFWGQVKYCILSVVPLVNVLREVDLEQKPAMDFLYELMRVAKEKIAYNCGNAKRKYMLIFKVIDARWKSKFHKPLHAAGYYLNPYFWFDEKISSGEEVKHGLYECMDRMMSYADRLKADVQLDQFDQANGDFGSRIAKDSIKLRSSCIFTALLNIY